MRMQAWSGTTLPMLLVSLFCMFVVAPVSAQDSEFDLITVLRQAEPRGVLATIVALEEVSPQVRALGQENLWMDLLATRLTFVHDAKNSIRLDSLAYAREKAAGADDSRLGELEPRPAMEEIVKLARRQRVVMLNEEHRRSQERAFANQLLEPLAQAGFTHLALETLDADEAALAARGYPLTSDGFYTKDPALGDLVRRALGLGWKVVGYEADFSTIPEEYAGMPMGRQSWREEQQGKNLAELLRAEPEARVLVWSGRHHMSEMPLATPDGSMPSLVPMGGRFRQHSGIDPLTVDLMVMKEAHSLEYEHPLYREAEGVGLRSEATVFVSEEGHPFSATSYIDVSVFLPRSRIESGRPHWMKMGGLRREVDLDTGNFDERPGLGKPLAIQARVADESPEAVPLDCVIWREGQPPVLLLRPGLNYELRVVAPSGEVVWRERLELR